MHLITREWVARNMPYYNDKEEDLKSQLEEIQMYLRDSFERSGLNFSDVDKMLGTNGMAGHYFGTSQWMFPTKDAYDSLRKVMDLPRDHFECAKIVRAYEFAKKTREAYGAL